MTHGKYICERLKEVRKRIAMENNIQLETEKCTFKGVCRGTCPRCEAEARYLENALADRLRIGKVATIAGLALGLATTTVQAQTVESEATLPTRKEAAQKNKEITLRGTVVDDTAGEAIPFTIVTFKKGKKTAASVMTNWDGEFDIKLHKGEYSIEIRLVGYLTYTAPEAHYDADTTLLPIRLVAIQSQLETIELENAPLIGILDPELFEANPAWQKFEKGGVKVIVR